MSISYFFEKIKPFYFLFLFVVIAAIFFALGRLSAIEERHAPIKIVESAKNQTANVISATSGEVIGSKNSKKYYFPWCGTVKNIKPENQVPFASADLAKQAGYVPGGNCKGLSVPVPTLPAH